MSSLRTPPMLGGIRKVPWGGHCQLNAKNLHMGAATRKLSLIFFFHDRLYFRHLYPVSFPHEEGARERFSLS